MSKIFVIDSRKLPFYSELWLSDERKKKLERFKNEKARLLSLSAELALIQAVRFFFPNAELPLRYARSSHGKPYLTDYPDLKINLSHSGDYAVCAADSNEIGIDIQRTLKPYPGIAERFFAQDECEYIGNDDLRFYEIWSKKESYLKATGTGMDVPLNSFSVLKLDNCRFTEYEPPETGYVLWGCELIGS